MELDYPLHGYDNEQNLHVKQAMFFPYGFVTTGRICPVKNSHYEIGSKVSMNNYKCNKKCEKIITLMNKQINTIILNNDNIRQKEYILVKKGNTVFYFNELNSLNQLSKIDRLIYQPKFML